MLGLGPVNLFGEMFASANCLSGVPPQKRTTWNEWSLLLLKEMVRCVHAEECVAGAVCSRSSLEARLLVSTISDALLADVGHSLPRT